MADESILQKGHVGRLAQNCVFSLLQEQSMSTVMTAHCSLSTLDTDTVCNLVRVLDEMRYPWA